MAAAEKAAREDHEGREDRGDRDGGAGGGDGGGADADGGCAVCNGSRQAKGMCACHTSLAHFIESMISLGSNFRS